MGRVHRDLGHVKAQRLDFAEALPEYHEAAKWLREVLTRADLPLLIEADIRQDLAEVLFFSKDYSNADAELQKIADLIGEPFIITPGTALPAQNLPVDRFAPLGKVELLRGQMIFAADPPKRSKEELIDGMKHQLLAYVYFMLFSSQAIEKSNMVEFTYNYMSPIPLPQRRAVMSAVQTWVDAHSLNAYVGEFLQLLNRLLT